MKKGGILNPQLNRIISEMGHGDMLIIADAGLPIPREVERIDLALKCGTPSFAEVLQAVFSELQIEEAYVAKEIKEKNPQTLNLISSIIEEVKFISHEELKELSKQARAIIRTGECSPYANIILISGVLF
ncbi:MAG: D-ribose pyranase [Candidatus Infernicultor aquiphilus]|uniref:D-ribose pyranase n=1 Tax=Candidatus Infernicultor aquiphilus TaxID=1805029 RepID=A0A2M7PN13_9BACT|nr:MAG: D-ribose pyranase [Candidatus Atribacteria bacterium CG_4_10_14_3_um_filter_34_13]